MGVPLNYTSKSDPEYPALRDLLPSMFTALFVLWFTQIPEHVDVLECSGSMSDLRRWDVSRRGSDHVGTMYMRCDTSTTP